MNILGSKFITGNFTVGSMVSPIFLRNEKPFCETCFHEKFGVVCVACKQFIMGTVLEVCCFIIADMHNLHLNG